MVGKIKKISSPPNKVKCMVSKYILDFVAFETQKYSFVEWWSLKQDLVYGTIK